MCKSGCGKIISGAKGLAKVAMQTAGINVDVCPPDVVKQRRDACRACDLAMRNPDPKFVATGGLTSLSKCQRCGCLIVAKTRLASESCPLDPPKW